MKSLTEKIINESIWEILDYKELHPYISSQCNDTITGLIRNQVDGEIWSALYQVDGEIWSALYKEEGLTFI